MLLSAELANRRYRFEERTRLPGGAMLRSTPGSAGYRIPAGAPGKTMDCWPGSKCGDLIVLLVPRFDSIPAQTVIQRELRSLPPTVLSVSANIFVAAIEEVQLTLVVLTRRADEEICEIIAGFAAREGRNFH